MLQRVFIVINPGQYWTEWPGGWELHFPMWIHARGEPGGWISSWASTLAFVKWAVWPTRTTPLSSLVVIHPWHQRLSSHGSPASVGVAEDTAVPDKCRGMGFIAVFYTDRPTLSQFQTKEAGLLILITFQSKSPFGHLFIWIFTF